ncbi:28S ribosomal protein S29, mitochondrial-like [Coregonus clupeaformis]|uniref:28S ribosomal protein S29, mitochondrial-like n=1 Tax=Coregonus clupeaformis TaxID=59861 RepID=UPI001E1C95D6|nr:28S ribosomal protein S29, mitochondrial-like [Coregonus clupeaformis]
MTIKHWKSSKSRLTSLSPLHFILCHFELSLSLSVSPPEELTLVHNLRKITNNDWCGGAVIATLSQTGSLYAPSSAYLPQELLGEEGFDSMDPFVPVPVSNYSEKEFESCYLYYLDSHWLQHPHSQTEEGKKELIFLSNRNPSVLERLCAFL